MNVKITQNRQMRSLGLALLASILAAVATMFIPVSVLEMITGASGLSELVPATAAPLGDTARALIAFGTGALVLALMSMLVLRRTNGGSPREAQPTAVVNEDQSGEPTFVASLMARLAKLRLPAMPWEKGDSDITDLSDLPKLRSGDIHPDAPARRPLLATHDLPVLDLTELEVQPVAVVLSAGEPIIKAKPAPFPTQVPHTNSNAESKTVDPQLTLSEMVAQLEASVALRQQQLADLEIVASNLAASKIVESYPTVETVVGTQSTSPSEVETSTETVRAEWPPLEAVPASPARQDDMDDALAAALATLHRMNGTNR
jgi:hypothetical protein